MGDQHLAARDVSGDLGLGIVGQCEKRQQQVAIVVVVVNVHGVTLARDAGRTV